MATAFHVPENRIWFKPESGWPAEVPKNMAFPRKSLAEMFDESVKKYASLNAIWFLDTWMTYEELGDHVDAFATALSEKGVKKGDCVAFLLPNSFQFVIAYFSCMKLGATVTPINPTYKPAEVLHQLQTTGATVLITLDALYPKIVAPIINKTTVKMLIATNIVDLVKISPLKKFLGKRIKDKKTGEPLIPSGEVPNALSFLKLLKTTPAVPRVKLDVEKDPAVYLMTGGSTGVPKAAVLTHFNLVSNAAQCKAWLYKAKTGCCVIGVIPLFHSYGMTAIMNTGIHIGAWMMLFPRPPKIDELCKRIVELVDEKKAFLCGTETLFQRIAEFEDIDKYDIAGKLECCISGAGPLHKPVQEKFEQITGAKLVEGYGLTETSPVISAGPFYGGRKIGTIGLPFPGTDWMIVDKDNPMRKLGIGSEQTGEICVSGPQIMKEYLNKPVETRNTIFEADGKRWLLTGDIGYMDEGGSIIICDRKKQLIKHKGYSVFPKEIEELLSVHKAVKEVAVAGIPDEKEGEVIKAWVALKPAYKGKVSEENLIKWCSENMAHYKVPKYIEFREELPKSFIGKVMRRELQEADPLYKAAMAKKK